MIRYYNTTMILQTFYFLFDLSRFLTEPENGILSTLFMLDILMIWDSSVALKNAWMVLRLLSIAQVLYRRLCA